MDRPSGRRETVRDRRNKLSKEEGIISRCALIATHSTQCNRQRGPDYSARLPTRYELLCFYVTRGIWWAGISRESSFQAGERLRFSAELFCSRKNLFARQSWVVDWKSCLFRLDISILILPNEFVVRIDSQRRGPRDHLFKTISVDLLRAIESSA